MPKDKLLDIWPIWNASMGARAPGDKGYLARVTRGSKTDAEYLWAQTTRLGMALGRTKYLPAEEAKNEARLPVLQIQRLKLGFPLGDRWQGEGASETLKTWFEKAAPGPMRNPVDWTKACNEGRGDRTEELNDEDYGDDEMTFKAGATVADMLIEVPLVEASRAEDQAFISTMQGRDITDLSPADLTKILEVKRRLSQPAAATTLGRRRIGLFDSLDNDMEQMPPVRQEVVPEPTTEASSLEQVLSRLTAMEQRLEPGALRALVGGQFGGAVKPVRREVAVRPQGVLEAQERQGEELEDEDYEMEEAEEVIANNTQVSLKSRMIAAVMSGGLWDGSRAKSRTTTEERMMDDKIDRLQRELLRNKLPNPDHDFARQYNFTLEEYCGLEVRLVRIELLCQTGGLTKDEAVKLQAKEESLHCDLEGLRRKRDILLEAVKMREDGDMETAEKIYKLFWEEERGYLQNPDVERLKKKARVALKQEEGLRTLRALQQQQENQKVMHRDNLAIQQKWLSAMSSSGGGSDGGGFSSRKRDAGGKPGDDISPGQASFKMKWVSGSAYKLDPDWEAPASRMFPKAHDYNMDAPGTKGLVNNGRCRFACGFCEKVTGHQGSECPARCWDEGGKRRVNFRWLFENGKCDGRGQPK